MELNIASETERQAAKRGTKGTSKTKKKRAASKRARASRAASSLRVTSHGTNVLADAFSGDTLGRLAALGVTAFAASDVERAVVAQAQAQLRAGISTDASDAVVAQALGVARKELAEARQALKEFDQREAASSQNALSALQHNEIQVRINKHMLKEQLLLRVQRHRRGEGKAASSSTALAAAQSSGGVDVMQQSSLVRTGVFTPLEQRMAQASSASSGAPAGAASSGENSSGRAQELHPDPSNEEGERHAGSTSGQEHLLAPQREVSSSQDSRRSRSRSLSARRSRVGPEATARRRMDAVHEVEESDEESQPRENGAVAGAAGEASSSNERVCPVCSQHFSSDTAFDSFAAHVEWCIERGDGPKRRERNEATATAAAAATAAAVHDTNGSSRSQSKHHRKHRTASAAASASGHSRAKSKRRDVAAEPGQRKRARRPASASASTSSASASASSSRKNQVALTR